MDRLTRAFYVRDAVTVARALLGQRLVRVVAGTRLAGRIVEVEAYLGEADRAAHTYGGRRTARNESMWGEGGRAYVYFTYGMHHCLNVVAGRAGEPVAVLIRGLEPVEGVGVMRQNRGVEAATALGSGPGKLCQALAITRALDGVDLVAGEALFIECEREGPYPEAEVATGPRIGVAYAGEWAKKPLRFFVRGNPHVSKR